jgi:hypothetical protein
MQNNTHLKSLKHTLLENNAKILAFTKKLMGMSILICIAILVLSINKGAKAFLFIAIPLCIYTLYTCYQIAILWRTHKKIQHKLNE